MAMKDGAVYRIEVRTGYKTLDGILRWPKRDSDQLDIYAVVFGDSVTYSPELP